MVKDLWILKAGNMNLDRSVLQLGTGYGITDTIAIYATLLETTEGYILIDTGMNTDGIDRPDEVWGERAKQLIPCITKEDDVANRLHEIGIKENDIKYVINTHLHWDHTGGNRHFPDAVFVVQKAEYRFAFNPDTAIGKSYMQNHYSRDAKYQLIEGDFDLCGGVRLLQTPGHTPGHQSVLITFENGKKAVIAGDAVYTWDNIDRLIPPGNLYSYELAMLSLNKLKTIRETTGAAVIPSHDPGEDFYDRISKILDDLKRS
jgi:N-acyl homoserine lactone hydrolase